MAAIPTHKAQYGSWISPITSDFIVASAIGFAETAVTKKYFYHSESRPSEGGRVAIVRTPADGSGPGKDVFGADWNARSRVHEYGGGAFTVTDADEVIFSHMKDGRLYRVALDGIEPTPITAEAPDLRYAAFQPHPLFTSTHPYLIAVDEKHVDPSRASGILNRLVLIDASSGEVTILHEGADFYHSPSFGGEKGEIVTFFSWMHPNMPWEESSLFLARLDGKKLKDIAHVAGGSGEGKQGSAVSQPKFSADGKTLLFLNDVSGFTLLYKWKIDGSAPPELAMEEIKSDLAGPDWTFGNKDYVLLDDSTVLIAPLIKSIKTPLLLDLNTKRTTAIAPPSKEDPFVVVTQLQAFSSSQVLFVGVSNASPSALMLATIQPSGAAEYKTIKVSAVLDRDQVPSSFFSHAQGLEFDVPGAGSDEGKQVNLNVIFYPPTNPHFQPIEGEKPPAVVRIHGGPTAHALPGLAWQIQYYTSRGYALLDVNYGGSSGYGREYRDRLRGNWGIVDVSDSVEAVKHCAKEGLIDGKRVAIIGGSAGGFTVLAALTKSNVFAAGVSSYGIGDLALLADGTHKFESEYLFRLVGGTPAEVPDVYRERSPVNSAEKITAPTLLLQGTEDKVVPMDQAQVMVKKIQAAGGRVECVYYEGEGHGFRQAKNIKDSLDRSRQFFEATFGIEPVVPNAFAP